VLQDIVSVAGRIVQLRQDFTIFSRKIKDIILNMLKIMTLLFFYWRY